ncbi:MAG: 6-phosphogluconolactonase [Chitinophagales bacterium]
MDCGQKGLPAPVLEGRVEKLRVKVYGNRTEMGVAAAAEAAEILRQAIAAQGYARAIFASAASQADMLAALEAEPGIDWSKVTAFHMDEYIGSNVPERERFGPWLKYRFFDKVHPGRVHYLNGQAADPRAECARYAALLREAPIDFCALGIGETGHLAFNDPPVCDFADPEWVKVVEIDELSREQQVRDGAFATVDEVPKTAFTLTMPALLTSRRMVTVVPGPTKKEAIKRTLTAAISTDCPSSILRQISRASLYLDSQSFSLVTPCVLKESECA